MKMSNKSIKIMYTTNSSCRVIMIDALAICSRVQPAVPERGRVRGAGQVRVSQRIRRRPLRAGPGRVLGPGSGGRSPVPPKFRLRQHARLVRVQVQGWLPSAHPRHGLRSALSRFVEHLFFFGFKTMVHIMI